MKRVKLVTKYFLIAETFRHYHENINLKIVFYFLFSRLGYSKSAKDNYFVYTLALPPCYLIQQLLYEFPAIPPNLAQDFTANASATIGEWHGIRLVTPVSNSPLSSISSYCCYCSSIQI